MNAIKITSHRTNLTGAIAVAYGLLGTALNKSLAAESGRSTWSDTLAYVAQEVGDKEGDAAVEACTKGIKSIKDALRGKAVLEALEGAGYGPLTKVIMQDDGKEGAPTKASAQLRLRFGGPWKLNKDIQKAETTIENYGKRLERAYKAGVSVEPTWRMRDLDEAVQKAELEAMSEDNRKEFLAKQEVNKIASAVGADFRNVYLEGTEGQLNILASMRTCILGYEDADQVLKDSLNQALEGFADKFAEAHRAAQEKRDAESASKEGSEETEVKADARVSGETLTDIEDTEEVESQVRAAA